MSRPAVHNGEGYNFSRYGLRRAAEAFEFIETSPEVREYSEGMTITTPAHTRKIDLVLNEELRPLAEHHPLLANAVLIDNLRHKEIRRRYGIFGDYLTDIPVGEITVAKTPGGREKIVAEVIDVDGKLSASRWQAVGLLARYAGTRLTLEPIPYVMDLAYLSSNGQDTSALLEYLNDHAPATIDVGEVRMTPAQ